MFGGLIAFIAIVALIVVAQRQQKRFGCWSRSPGSAQGVPVASRSGDGAPALQAERRLPLRPRLPRPARRRASEAAATVRTPSDAGSRGCHAGTAAAARSRSCGGAGRGAGRSLVTERRCPSQPAAAKPARPTIETALGTRWAVWVGGLALALGGLFLVRYSIEAGIFGPEVRLTHGRRPRHCAGRGGEFIRRTGFRMPVEGVANAYVPGILTAAGAFTLFGTVYAAHGVYGFIGPAAAFVLLGAIGVATIAASLVHGQALAGVGIARLLCRRRCWFRRSRRTTGRCSAIWPSCWSPTVSIARLRDWTLLAAAGFAGAGLWTLLYLADGGPSSTSPSLPSSPP